MHKACSSAHLIRDEADFLVGAVAEGLVRRFAAAAEHGPSLARNCATAGAADLEALLTPDNCMVVMIDHQPFQLANVNSHEPTIVINNGVWRPYDPDIQRHMRELSWVWY